MDQCSRHAIPPAVRGDLTGQQGHDLSVGLETWDSQCSLVGGSVTSLIHTRNEVVDPHEALSAFVPLEFAVQGVGSASPSSPYMFPPIIFLTSPRGNRSAISFAQCKGSSMPSGCG